MVEDGMEEQKSPEGRNFVGCQRGEVELELDLVTLQEACEGFKEWCNVSIVEWK